MQVSIIQIGNSKGIRLPKTILAQYEINDKVELILEKDHILIKPTRKPRSGWDEVFKMMHENGEDELLIPDVFEETIVK